MTGGYDGGLGTVPFQGAKPFQTYQPEFRSLIGRRQLILQPTRPSASRENLVDGFHQLRDPPDHFVDVRLFQYERRGQGDDVAGCAHQ